MHEMCVTDVVINHNLDLWLELREDRVGKACYM